MFTNIVFYEDHGAFGSLILQYPVFSLVLPDGVIYGSLSNVLH
jgi:hypothetical protein